ncbi:class I SAM-dependent methyltransferase [Oscillatoria salina]|uniref:class I SAM-dependent methyltransferase n=1 Tax=Oscillatoria salina TaxID=331517 RepID=UPI001CCA87F9|nr:class I SAM-dependent methyltransferase [Oscillatoria salina]MBZ8181868.1 class I SAM-dependent methyltransferase [Oscillatoria salina IIICB1]
MLLRKLEPELMDSPEEAAKYDAMDFEELNTAFAEKAISLAPISAKVLDVGTGTARIPILACQKRPEWQLIGIDLAQSMLNIGIDYVATAGLQSQISLAKIDAKNIPYNDQEFDLVMSNSLVHHLPDPLPFLREVKRVVKSKGAILFRDLLRPESEEKLEKMVAQIGKKYDEQQKKLFRDSLHAAFTLSEVEKLVKTAGLSNLKVYQSSDRHWTAEGDCS